MSHEEKVEIYFTLNFPAKTIFDFIIKPENMVLYTGFLLIPGIKNVISSDVIRKAGTVDKISNTDSGSHESTTDILDENKRYCLTIRNIFVPGFKGKLANPLLGFREDWIFNENPDGSTSIERTLFIIHKEGFLNKLLVTYVVRPQLYFSFLKHHQNILKALS